MSRFCRAAAALAATLGMALPAVRAQEIVPADVLVRTVTMEVLEIVSKDRDIQAGDRKKAIALVEEKVVPHFNFTAMTASAVGTNWGKATPEQKQRLVEEFRTLLVRTYSSALAAYRNQKFDFRPLRAKPTDTEVTVQVRVLQPGAEPIRIDYEMERGSRGWKVWDVRVADISLVANYRTEFANIVRDSGIDGLIRALQEKNRRLEAGAPAAASATQK